MTKRPAALTSRLGFSLVANFLGRGWAILSGVAFLPQYVQLLGVEAYGLVGFYLSLLMIMSVAGLGLSATLSREVARLSATQGDCLTLAKTVRTIELTYGLLVLIVATTLFAGSPWIADYWLTESSLPRETLISAIRLMAATLAGQFLINLYEGGLVGQDRQVFLNCFRVTVGIIQCIGGLIVLHLIERTIQAYFWWQLSTVTVAAIVIRWSVWRGVLAASKRQAAFDVAVLRQIWRYSAGMVGLSLTAIMIGEADKMVVSRTLSLEVFGFYIIVWTLARLPSTMISPVSQAFFPRLVHLATSGSCDERAHTYHIACQLTSLLTLPIVLTLCFYPQECLTLWLGVQPPNSGMHIVLSILVLGAAAQAVGQVPHALQLAHGWPMLSVWLNGGTAAASIPITILLARHWGASGAALAWAIMSVSSAGIAIGLIHRRFLSGQGWYWLRADVVLPCLCAVAPIAISRVLIPSDSANTLSRFSLLAQLTCIWATATFVTVISLSKLRCAIVDFVRSTGLRIARSRWPAAPSDEAPVVPTLTK